MFLLNILWFLFGGLLLALSWCLPGLLLCLTVIGIPFGVQCFKIAGLMLAPFGRRISYDRAGCSSLLFNVLWILIFGWELALVTFLCGCLWCLTIVGIPVGRQLFKYAELALAPFGATVL